MNKKVPVWVDELIRNKLIAKKYELKVNSIEKVLNILLKDVLNSEEKEIKTDNKHIKSNENT